MKRPVPTDKASRILEMHRVFDAPRERVFQAFIDPDLLASWWGPDGFGTPRARVAIEPEVGGRHDKVMVVESEEIAAGMGMHVGAEFPDASRVIEIRVPELLVLASGAQPGTCLVEDTITRIEFHAEGASRTRVVLIDGPYAEMMAANAETGWRQSLDKLARLLAG